MNTENTTYNNNPLGNAQTDLGSSLGVGTFDSGLTKTALSKNISISNWNDLVHLVEVADGDIYDLKAAVDTVIDFIGKDGIYVNGKTHVVPALNSLKDDIDELADRLENLDEDAFVKKLDRIFLTKDGYGACPSLPDSVYNNTSVGTNKATYVEHYSSDGNWYPMVVRTGNASLPSNPTSADFERYETSLRNSRIIMTNSDGRLTAVAPDGNIYLGEDGESAYSINTGNSVVTRHYADSRYMRKSDGDGKYVKLLDPDPDFDQAYIVAKETGKTIGRPVSTSSTLTRADGEIVKAPALVLRNSNGLFDVGTPATDVQPLNTEELLKRIKFTWDDTTYKLTVAFETPQKKSSHTGKDFVTIDGIKCALIGQIDLPIESLLADIEYVNDYTTTDKNGDLVIRSGLLLYLKGYESDSTKVKFISLQEIVDGIGASTWDFITMDGPLLITETWGAFNKEDGPHEIGGKGVSIKELFMEALCTELEAVVTQPKIVVEATQGSTYNRAEVGTAIPTSKFKATVDGGKFSYGSVKAPGGVRYEPLDTGIEYGVGKFTLTQYYNGSAVSGAKVSNTSVLNAGTPYYGSLSLTLGGNQKKYTEGTLTYNLKAKAEATALVERYPLTSRGNVEDKMVTLKSPGGVDVSVTFTGYYPVFYDNSNTERTEFGNVNIREQYDAYDPNAFANGKITFTTKKTTKQTVVIVPKHHSVPTFAYRLGTDMVSDEWSNTYTTTVPDASGTPVDYIVYSYTPLGSDGYGAETYVEITLK